MIVIIIIMILIAGVSVNAKENQVIYPPKVLCKIFSIKSGASEIQRF